MMQAKPMDYVIIHNYRLWFRVRVWAPAARIMIVVHFVFTTGCH